MQHRRSSRLARDLGGEPPVGGVELVPKWHELVARHVPARGEAAARPQGPAARGQRQ